MRKWFLPAMFFVCFAMEYAFLPSLRFFNAQPDLLMVTTVFAAGALGALPAAVYGMAGGIFRDALTGSPFGVQALLYFLAGYAASVFFKRADSPLALWLATALLAALKMLVHQFLLLIAGIPVPGLWQGLIGVVLPGTLYTLVAAMLFYYPLKRVSRLPKHMAGSAHWQGVFKR